MVPNNPDQLSCATTGCISLAVGQKDCTAINLRTNKSSGIHKMILTCSGLGCSKSEQLYPADKSLSSGYILLVVQSKFRMRQFYQLDRGYIYLIKLSTLRTTGP